MKLKLFCLILATLFYRLCWSNPCISITERPYLNFCKALYLYKTQNQTDLISEEELTLKVFEGLKASDDKNVDCSEKFENNSDWDYLFCEGKKLAASILKGNKALNFNKPLSYVVSAFFFIDNVGEFGTNNGENHKLKQIAKIIAKSDHKMILSLLTVFDHKIEDGQFDNHLDPDHMKISEIFEAYGYAYFLHGTRTIDSAKNIIGNGALMNYAAVSKKATEPYVYLQMIKPETLTEQNENSWHPIVFVFNFQTIDEYPFILNNRWRFGVRFGYGDIETQSGKLHGFNKNNGTHSINSFSSKDKMVRLANEIKDTTQGGMVGHPEENELLIFGNLDLKKHLKAIYIQKENYDKAYPEIMKALLEADLNDISVKSF